MNKLHLSLATEDVASSVVDYSARLGYQPVLIVQGEYALWRTPTLNFSVQTDESRAAGTLRHLGWEDDEAQEFAKEDDVNGIEWERFSAHSQAGKIIERWPDCGYVVP